jgi:hypothetical protein
MEEIQAAGRFRFTGIVNNSNLGRDTSANDIIESEKYAKEFSKLVGLPVRFTSVINALAGELEGTIPNLFRINLTAKSIWAL